MWAQDVNGNFVNLDQAVGLFANQNGSDWNIRAATTDGSMVDLSGIFSSEGDAQTAAQRLIDGVDPSDY